VLLWIQGITTDHIIIAFLFSRLAVPGLEEVIPDFRHLRKSGSERNFVQLVPVQSISSSLGMIPQLFNVSAFHCQLESTAKTFN